LHPSYHHLTVLHSLQRPILTQINNLIYAKLLADHAHSKRLAVAQKNTAHIGSVGKTTVAFEFAIAEECQVNNECSSYQSNVYGSSMLEVEYTDNGKKP
jgi:hypothetical protein